MSLTDIDRHFVDLLKEKTETLPTGIHRLEAEEALLRFSQSGLPTRRSESWRYSAPARFMSEVYPPASQEETSSKSDKIDDDSSDADAVLTFVNGRLVYGLSRGITASPHLALMPLSALMDCGYRRDEFYRTGAFSQDALADINLLMADEALGITLKSESEKPFKLSIRHLVQADQPVSAYGRIALLIMPGSKIDLVELFSQSNDKPYQRNQVSTISLGEGASLSHTRLRQGGGCDIDTLAARLATSARYEFFPISFGALLDRQQVSVELKGEGASFQLTGAALLKGQSHGDLTLVVNHQAPHCRSEERYKVVLDDEAMGVFQGKVVVDRIAQKTEGEMMARALLLGDKVRFRGKPELEIFADDVVCGHGTTSAALDPQEIYYLRSRGIGLDDARAILTEAFLAEILSEIPDEGLAQGLIERFRNSLGRPPGEGGFDGF